MPSARYGEAAHVLRAAMDGAVHVSKPKPVNTPGPAWRVAAAPPETAIADATKHATTRTPARLTVSSLAQNREDSVCACGPFPGTVPGPRLEQTCLGDCPRAKPRADMSGGLSPGHV